MSGIRFTLVSTVFNEEARLGQTIADLEAQTVRPAEAIITDAGSTDGTYERLLEWQKTSPFPVRILQRRGCNIAQGRNMAIEAARTDLIASTDFGCRFKPGWLESIIKPFAQDAQLMVVGGAFDVSISGGSTLAARADYILQDGYPVRMDEYFSVSSRSIAFKKEVWRQIGGYQEWLTLAADDTIFWRQIKQAKFKYRFIEEPNVEWIRHQAFIGFAKEAWRYGLGDGESRINFRNFFSVLAETTARWFLYLLVLAAPVWLMLPYRIFPVVATLFCMAIAFRPHQRANASYARLKNSKGYGLKELLAAYYLIDLTRIYYLTGYLRGWLLASGKVRQSRGNLGTLPV